MAQTGGGELAILRDKLRDFSRERDWDQFHTPKNLAMALAAEAGELLEVFQWLTEQQSQQFASRPTDLAAARAELADIFIYLIRLADVLQVDLLEAVHEKIHANAEKYPVRLAFGNATKYSRRERE